MAQTPDSDQGVTTSTTPVVVVSPPGSGERVVVRVNVYNADVVDHGYILKRDDGATQVRIGFVLVTAGNMGALLVAHNDGPSVLDSADTGMTLETAEATDTNESDWDVSWLDVT